MNALSLLKLQRLEWAKDSVFVNGFDLLDHDALILTHDVSVEWLPFLRVRISVYSIKAISSIAHSPS